MIFNSNLVNFLARTLLYIISTHEAGKNLTIAE